VKLGEIEVRSLSDGTFRLDGGAMFGIIPKPLWERRSPADERNRILLGLRPLLVRTGGQTVLVDTGIGDKYDEKERDTYAIAHETTLAASLGSAGLGPEDVDVVVLTHLHFDHGGGNTRVDPDSGHVVPTFPRARYVIHKDEWETALHPDLRSRASYRRENLLPLEEGGRLDLIDGPCEIAPGVRTLPTPGHTRGHQSVLVEGGGRTLVFPGDILPTAAHLDLPYIMGYDLYPATTLKEKEKLVSRIVDESWIVAFEHDPELSLATVQRDGRRFRARPLGGNP
jgi:glyoxylase-like metal-dependent hydrolase (beta-lactamase superfamily II)